MYKYREHPAGSAHSRVSLAQNERVRLNVGKVSFVLLFTSLFVSLLPPSRGNRCENKNVGDANAVRNSGLQTRVRELSQEQQKDRKKEGEKNKRAHFPHTSITMELYESRLYSL